MWLWTQESITDLRQAKGETASHWGTREGIMKMFELYLGE